MFKTTFISLLVHKTFVGLSRLNKEVEKTWYEMWKSMAFYSFELWEMQWWHDLKYIIVHSVPTKKKQKKYLCLQKCTNLIDLKENNGIFKMWLYKYWQLLCFLKHVYLYFISIRKRGDYRCWKTNQAIQWQWGKDWYCFSFYIFFKLQSD